MTMPFKQRWLYFIILALILCIPAFYNGFPLLFPDTTGYIRQGFSGTIGVNKPWLYSGFLRHSSLWETLWLVVFSQGIIITGTVYLLFKYFFKGYYKDHSFVVYMFSIAATTSIAFHVCMLMPDIFTPIVVLSTCLLLLAQDISKKDYCLSVLLFVFAAGVHNSNFVLAIGLVLLVTFGAFLKPWRPLYQKLGLSARKIASMFVILVGTYLSICTLNYTRGGEFTATRGGSIFLFARLCDFGIAQAYLKENCSNLDYKICHHIGELGLSGNFLWGGYNNFFNRTGSWSDENKAFYSKLTKDILSQPKYLKKYIICSIEAMFMQFVYCGDDPLSQVGGTSGGIEMTNEYYPTYLLALKDSRQMRGHYDDNQTQAGNMIQYVILILSGLLVVMLLLDRSYSEQHKAIALLILFGMLINAFIAGATSGVFDRYQSRVAWLITLPAFWYVYEQLKQLKKMFFSRLQSNDS